MQCLELALVRTVTSELAGFSKWHGLAMLLRDNVASSIVAMAQGIHSEQELPERNVHTAI